MLPTGLRALRVGAEVASWHIVPKAESTGRSRGLTRDWLVPLNGLRDAAANGEQILKKGGRVPHQVRIKRTTCLLVEKGFHLTRRPTCLIGAGGEQGVDHVHEADDAGGQRDGFALQPEGITIAVIAFVVQEYGLMNKGRDIG